MSFALLGSRCSVRVQIQVRFGVRGSGFERGTLKRALWCEAQGVERRLQRMNT